VGLDLVALLRIHDRMLPSRDPAKQTRLPLGIVDIASRDGTSPEGFPQGFSLCRNILAMGIEGYPERNRFRRSPVFRNDGNDIPIVSLPLSRHLGGTSTRAFPLIAPHTLELRGARKGQEAFPKILGRSSQILDYNRLLQSTTTGQEPSQDQGKKEAESMHEKKSAEPPVRP
jgi:hypothetical protein